MFRVKYGPHEADLCATMLATLFSAGSVDVSKVKGSVYVACTTKPYQQGRIRLSDVKSVEPAKGLVAECEEHGRHCP